MCVFANTVYCRGITNTVLCNMAPSNSSVVTLNAFIIRIGLFVCGIQIFFRTSFNTFYYYIKVKVVEI